MAQFNGKRITELERILGTELSANDLIEVVDQSEPNAEDRNKKLLLGEFAAFVAALVNPPERTSLQPSAGATTLFFISATTFTGIRDIFLYRNGILLEEGSLNDYTYSAAAPNSIVVELNAAVPTQAGEKFQMVIYKE